MPEYDVVVIGSGSAGLVAAKTASRWGKRTAIVEKEARTGGDCTWVGCVPSKALIHCSKVAHEVRTAHQFGVHCGADAKGVSASMEQMKRHIEKAQNTVYAQDDSREVLRAAGIAVYTQKEARFVDKHRLSLKPVPAAGGREKAENDAEVELNAKRFIVCTGAAPVTPPVEGINKVPHLTYETVFSELTEVPKTMAVLGGGPIGSELAQAFARLGATVHLIGRLMPRESESARQVMTEAFKNQGVELCEGRAKSVAQNANGGVTLTLSTGRAVEVGSLLVATGRKPKALELLNLEACGASYDPKSGIKVDNKLQTTAKHVFAAGDCTGGLQFTHLAGYQGALAAWNAVMPSPGRFKTPPNSAVPRCNYTHPEVAGVGLSLAEAKANSARYKVLEQNVQENDRAIAEGQTEGFFRLIVESKNGKIVGAEIVSARAGEVASELAVAIHAGLTVQDLAGTMHPYPALSFALQTMASEEAYNQAERSGAVSMLRACCGCFGGI